MRTSKLFSLLLLTITSPIMAADYYVSTTGTGEICSKSTPCAIIQFAVNKAQAGDKVHIAAGTYVQNIKVGTPATPNSKPGITISGAGAGQTILVSPGADTQRPAGVAADIVVDVWSQDTVIENLTIKHPAGAVVARDMGVFVAPPAKNTVIRNNTIVRERSGEFMVGSAPGSRGVFVFRAADTVVSHNHIKGHYEDHIHMPTNTSLIKNNKVENAKRLGIVVIQENATSNSTGNIVMSNIVTGSGSDGIQIQGDANVVMKNIISNNLGAAIKLCGIAIVGDCVNPFDAWSDASGNNVSRNKLNGNGNNTVVDNGTANHVK